jgi:isopenicillin N synthase-like dioxygenase
MEYEQGSSGQTRGYKKMGANATASNGDPDLIEFLNIPTEHARRYPTVVGRWPNVVQKRMGVAQTFQQQADAICRTIMSALERRLDLPAGSFDKLHDVDNGDNSELRLIRCEPQPDLPPGRLAQVRTVADGLILALTMLLVGAHRLW